MILAEFYLTTDSNTPILQCVISQVPSVGEVMSHKGTDYVVVSRQWVSMPKNGSYPFGCVCKVEPVK